MPILNVHAGSLPSFSLRMNASDSLESIRQRSAAKIRLDLKDGIPLVIKYAHRNQSYTLEDDDDWEIFVERFGNEKEADNDFLICPGFRNFVINKLHDSGFPSRRFALDPEETMMNTSFIVIQPILVLGLLEHPAILIN